jgi:hypothetical protein
MKASSSCKYATKLTVRLQELVHIGLDATKQALGGHLHTLRPDSDQSLDGCKRANTTSSELGSVF